MSFFLFLKASLSYLKIALFLKRQIHKIGGNDLNHFILDKENILFKILTIEFSVDSYDTKYSEYKWSPKTEEYCLHLL